MGSTPFNHDSLGVTKSRQKAIQRRGINTQQFNSAKPWKQVTFEVAGNNGLDWWAFAGNETSGNITQCTLLSVMNDIFFGGYGNIIEIQLHKSLAKSLICLGSRRRRQGGQEMSLHDHPRQCALSPKNLWTSWAATDISWLVTKLTIFVRQRRPYCPAQVCLFSNLCKLVVQFLWTRKL